MPIRNLTEKRRLPRLGKIHLGIKVNGPKGQYPQPVDYFVCPPEIQEVYGEKPNALEITFVSDDLEACASQWYRAYKQTTGLVCKGNGYTADALLDTDKLRKTGGEITAAVWAGSTSKHVVRQPIDCPGEGFDGEAPCPLYAAKGCKRLMMLQFVVVGVGGIGVWQIDTSSINSIQNVNGFLEMLKALTGGRIAGIPLTLRLVPHEVAPDGHKKTVRVLELATDKTMPELLKAGEGPVAQLLLPPPDDELPEDFFSEQAAEPVEGEIVDPEEEGEPGPPLASDDPGLDDRASGPGLAPGAERDDLPNLGPAKAPRQRRAAPAAPLPAAGNGGEPAPRLDRDGYFVLLQSEGLTVNDMAATLGCDPTEVWPKTKAWINEPAASGRSVRGLLELAREETSKREAPAPAPML